MVDVDKPGHIRNAEIISLQVKQKVLFLTLLAYMPPNLPHRIP